ncbi:MAG TPA: TIGR02265 family protein [Caldithrix sp.]|nr:TIGR02265 family protein [Caldithrix sp.]
MSDIRGLIIQSRLDYIEAKDGGKTYNKVFQKLSEPVRQSVGEQVFPTNLYPFHQLRDLDLAIGESIDQPLESIFREIGSQFAQKTLDRYFFNYLESQDPQKFLAQIDKLYGYLWSFGEYSYQKNKANSASVRFDYDEDIHKTYCWFMQQFLIKGVEMCGGVDVKLDEKECEAEGGGSCTYRISWSK